MVGEEDRHAQQFDAYFIIEPEFNFWDKNIGQGGKPLALDFQYASNTNTKWITKERMQEILNTLAKDNG